MSNLLNLGNEEIKNPIYLEKKFERGKYNAIYSCIC